MAETPPTPSGYSTPKEPQEHTPLLPTTEGPANPRYDPSVPLGGGGAAAKRLGTRTPRSAASSISGFPLPSKPSTPAPRPPSTAPPTRGRLDTLAQRAHYYVPILDWAPAYSARLLLGDCIAGLTVACLVVPQSISYASNLAKINPVHGLFSAAIPAIGYALFGTCRQLSVGPEAALSLLIGSTITDIAGDVDERPMSKAVALSTLITLQIGGITFLLGFFRLGFIDAILSRALLRGFVTGVGCIITLEQLIPMLGLTHLEHQLDPETTLQKAAFLVEHLSSAHRATAIIAFSALAALVLIRAAKRQLVKVPQLKWLIFVPEVLVCVVLTTVLSAVLRWDEIGVDVLGAIDLAHVGLDIPFNSTFVKHFKDTFPVAIVCSIIGYIDSIVAAKQNASQFGYTISPNRELVALGAGNLLASFCPGTLPAFGAITRSRLNAAFGARTQVSSLVTSALVILSAFTLLPYFYYLPRAILASIICLVIGGILAEFPEDLHYYIHMRAWTDLGLMSLTFLLTTLWSVQAGIAISVALSLLLVVKKSARTRIRILGRVPGTEQWKPIEDTPDSDELEHNVSGILVVRIREPLHFANTGQIKERLRRLELFGPGRHHPSSPRMRDDASAIVFHMGDVENVDASALQILHEIAVAYLERGVPVCFAHLVGKSRRKFETAGIVDLLGEGAFHENVGEAVHAIERSAEFASPGSAPIDPDASAFA